MPLQIDLPYIWSFPGLLRLGQFVLGIIVLICVSASNYPERQAEGLLNFTAAGSLLTSLIVLILYVLHIPELGALARIPWFLIELIYSAIWAAFYFISGCVAVNVAVRHANVSTNLNSSYGAATFFCWVAMAVYGVGAFIFYRRWRANPTIAHGGGGGVTVAERTVTTTTVTSKY